MQNLSWKREYVPVLLALFIIGITLFYYYGLRSVSTMVSDKTSTENQQLQILASLKATTTTGLSNTEQRKVLGELSKTQDTGHDFSQAGQLQILKSLKSK